MTEIEVVDLHNLITQAWTYHATCTSNINRRHGVTLSDGKLRPLSFDMGTVVTISCHPNYVRISKMKRPVEPTSVLVAEGRRPPEPRTDILSAHSGLVIYQTQDSLLRQAHWRAEHGRPAYQFLSMFEKAIVMMIDEGRLTVETEKQIEKFVKLKALATAPGSPGEGQAATLAALNIVNRILGKED